VLGRDEGRRAAADHAEFSTPQSLRLDKADALVSHFGLVLRKER
jgi:hypothetical protein